MTVVTYRPLELKLHSYGLSLGDGVGVSVEDIRERFAVRARRLRLNNVLRVFEAHAEKNQAVLRLLATDAAGAGEGVDLELENSGGKSLRGAKRGEGSPGAKTHTNSSLQNGARLHHKPDARGFCSAACPKHVTQQFNKSINKAPRPRGSRERCHSPSVPRRAAGDTAAASVPWRVHRSSA